MKIYDLNNETLPDISKKLEDMTFKGLQKIPDSYLKKDFRNWVSDKTESDINAKREDYFIQNENKTSKEETQFRSFQKAMIILFAYGQCLGINPVSGIFGRNISKIRFITCSWKFLYSLIIVIFQTMAMCLCWYRLFTSQVSVKNLAFVSFYFSTWCTTIIFFRIAMKWNALVKTIYNCSLDQYIDANMVKRVILFSLLSLFLALLEHLLSTFAKIYRVYDCSTHENSVYEDFMTQSYPWLSPLGLPFNIPLAVLVQFVNIIATLNWNYADVFIACMSLYLTSILKEINKTINWAVEMNYLSSSKWAQLREDYTRATCLVKLFDEIFSGLILISFANNLFFICLQLYNFLTEGIHLKEIATLFCPNFPSGPLGGLEYPVYLTYSLLFLLLRFLTVSLIAAEINVVSLIPNSALYRIPTSAYNVEVQRFVQQVNGNNVALSGLNFFYITRELILSVAGTIVTYELVLLQFRGDNNNSD